MSSLGALISSNPQEARRRVVAALHQTGSRDRAAKSLGVQRSTLYTWMARLQIADDEVGGQPGHRHAVQTAPEKRVPVPDTHALAQMVAAVIKTRITALQERFVDDVAAVMGELMQAFAMGAGFAQSTSSAAKSAGRPRRPRVGASAPSTAGMEDRVLSLVAGSADGMRMEQLNKQLGAAPGQLASRMRTLVAEGKLRTEGQKRGTTYFAV